MQGELTTNKKDVHTCRKAFFARLAFSSTTTTTAFEKVDMEIQK